MAKKTALIKDSELLPLFRLPSLVFLEVFPDDSILLTKPRSEERETGKNQTTVGGSQESHFDPVGSLLFWVSCVADCVNSGSSTSLFL